MQEPTDDDLSGQIKAVLNRYQALRKRPRQSLVWTNMNPRHPQKQVGIGFQMIRSEMIAQQLIGSPNSAALREGLLLEATRRGYEYLVTELLCPTTSLASSSLMMPPPPVSINVKDQRGNTLFHLAVMSGSVRLVRWMLKYINRKNEEDTGSYLNQLDKLRSLNDCGDTPFSLAIRRGNMRLIFSFVNSKIDYIHYWSFETRENALFDWLFIPNLREDFREGKRSIEELKQKVVEFRQNKCTKRPDIYFADRTILVLSVLEARRESHDTVKDAIDSWIRPRHLQMIDFIDHELTFLSFQQRFSGVFNPWWDARLSSFDIGSYISGRSERESDCLFGLLNDSISSGCFDTAMWLLTYWKTPPSVLSLKFREDIDISGEWYLRNATKVIEAALFGWIYDKMPTMKDETCTTMVARNVIDDTMGSWRCRDSKARNSPKIQSYLWQVDLGQERRFDLEMIWKTLHEDAPKSDGRSYYAEKWFGVTPKIYTAIKLACTFRLRDFEESKHAKLLTHFLEKVYNQDPNFLSADLPSLAKFVVLDYLPFFQYLSKHRGNGSNNQTSFLDLDMPLLCPRTNLDGLDAGEGDDEDEDFDNLCSICMEQIDHPYTLRCGHKFHHLCLFQYIFPLLRDGNADANDLSQQAHQVLSKAPHLSFTLGKTNCPYCRQSVKPNLKEAFALNLADGLRRTVSERRKRPNSPHFDVAKCPTGVTVGQALLAFAACSGAIGIFQWLVTERGIKPDASIGEVNVMHYAVAHNQVLIVRWLLKNGYSSLLFGGMETDAFDTFVPSCLGLSASDTKLNLEDENIAKRFRFWKQEVGLSQLQRGDDDNFQYSDEEMELLGKGMTEEMLQTINLRSMTERQSPMHYLLMNSMVDFHGERASYGFLPDTNTFFKSVKALGVSVVPANWYQLVLALNDNSSMRSDAKAFLSQEVLALPSQALNMPQHYGQRTQSTFDDVLTQPSLDKMPVLTIARNPSQFNLLQMLVHQKDWKHFLQVAAALDVWKTFPSFEWFEDRPQIYELMRALVILLIDYGRVDVITAFATMESFGGLYGSLFDLFSNEQEARSHKLALRPIIEERGKMDIFSPFLERIDRVREVRQSLCISSLVGRLLHSKKSLEQIKLELNRQREDALLLAGHEEPLGIGSRERVLEDTDIGAIDWLSDTWHSGGSSIRIFDLAMQQHDPKLIHWVFSQVMRHKNNIEKGDEDFFFLRIATKAIIDISDLFVLQEFVRFCTGEDGLPKFRGRRDLFMAELLNAAGKNIQIPDHVYGGPQGGGGVLGDIFSRILELSQPFEYERDQAETQAKIEMQYDLARWVLDQPEIVALLAVEETRAKCVTNIFTGESNSSFSCFSSNSPLAMFRMFTFMLSYNFDLSRDIGGTNLVALLLEWNKGCMRSKPTVDDAIDHMFMSCDYQDNNGNPVRSLSLLIRWLVLDVGISIQHLRYDDLVANRTLHKDLSMSAEEFDQVKADQLSKLKAESAHEKAGFPVLAANLVAAGMAALAFVIAWLVSEEEFDQAKADQLSNLKEESAGGDAWFLASAANVVTAGVAALIFLYWLWRVMGG